MATLQKKDNTYQDIIQNKEEYYIKSSQNIQLQAGQSRTINTGLILSDIGSGNLLELLPQVELLRQGIVAETKGYSNKNKGDQVQVSLHNHSKQKKFICVGKVLVKMFLKMIINDGIKMLLAESDNNAFRSGKKTKRINKLRVF